MAAAPRVSPIEVNLFQARARIGDEFAAAVIEEAGADGIREALCEAQVAVPFADAMRGNKAELGHRGQKCGDG